MELVPIALFVYNRPVHTKRTIEALRKNKIASSSELFVFSDAPKTEKNIESVKQVRSITGDIQGFKKVITIDRNTNFGVAGSIIEGVTGVCKQYGKVIVLEDDLIVSEHFLEYMNETLSLYEKEKRVMQIAGHMVPVELKAETDAVFLPFTTSWGWATWQRAWQEFDPLMVGYEALKASRMLQHRFNLAGSYPYFEMLKAQREGKIDSWAIRWYLSVFMRKGLTLFPVKTMVENIGFDSSGVHCGTAKQESVIDLGFSVNKYPNFGINDQFMKAIIAHFQKGEVLPRKFKEKIGALIKYVYR